MEYFQTNYPNELRGSLYSPTRELAKVKDNVFLNAVEANLPSRLSEGGD